MSQNSTHKVTRCDGGRGFGLSTFLPVAPPSSPIDLSCESYSHIPASPTDLPCEAYCMTRLWRVRVAPGSRSRRSPAGRTGRAAWGTCRRPAPPPRHPGTAPQRGSLRTSPSTRPWTPTCSPGSVGKKNGRVVLRTEEIFNKY